MWIKNSVSQFATCGETWSYRSEKIVDICSKTWQIKQNTPKKQRNTLPTTFDCFSNKLNHGRRNYFFQRAATSGFLQFFCRCGPKLATFSFSCFKLKKQRFLLKFSKPRGPCPPPSDVHELNTTITWKRKYRSCSPRK